MKVNAIIVLVYGILLCLGGLMGFIKAGSFISLMMGSLFGIIAIVAAIALFKKNRRGALVALVLSLILDAFFTYRYMLSGNFMPGGLMSILSLIVLLSSATLLRKTKAKAKK
jgi:uncharacterized membrane protein (UPF0136 family)